MSFAGAGRFRFLLFASLALAALCTSAHAAGANPDYTYFWLALLIPTAIVAVAYMASYAFGAPSLRAALHDELLQILATGAVALTLVGTQLVVDGYVVATLNAAGAAGEGIDSVMDAASQKVAQLEGATAGALGRMQDVSMALGREASKGTFCNFLGVGFSISNCSPFNAYRGSLTAAAFATSTALADMHAQGYILSLARAYGFTVLIPIGLLLRCFKASRGAGGALIAVGFGFYTVYPAVILATDNLLHGPSPPAVPELPIVGECDPMETSISTSLSQFTGYGDELASFAIMKAMSYYVLVRVLFLSILDLIITLGFIRLLAHMIGSDIDVSSLARIS